MYKFAVRMLKNRLFPVSVPEGVELEHNKEIIVRTEKGDELAVAMRLPGCVLEKWGKQLPPPVEFVKVVTIEDKKVIKDLAESEDLAFKKCSELIETHKLPMRLVETNFTFDKKKLTFYFTAPYRVDFRELLKDLTQSFKKVRIDLRHIGVRDETSILEGLGPCGKEFCCCSWVKQFNSINIKLAKDQGMPINPSKISGVCGRLLCCLNYEYSTYIDAAVGMPPVGSGVITADGIGRVCSLHFLNGKVAVKLEDGRVKEFTKQEIEMLEEEVSNIEIELPNQYIVEEEENIDISQLEEKDSGSTGNV